VRDITGRKPAETALRLSEERFALAVAGSYSGIWDIDFVARSVFFSARARELCGLPPGPEAVPLDGWFEALPLHPEDRPRRTAAVQAHLSGKAPVYEGEFRLLQPDGVYRWRHLHGVCVRDADGNPLRMGGSISDVDVRRRAEDALRESEERYERVVAAAQAGIWDWDVLHDHYYVSPRLLEMAALPPDTVIAGRADFLARAPLTPTDLEKWQREVQALFASDGSRLSTDMRVTLDGGMRWYRFDGMCFRNAAGGVVRWTGSVTDITERKVAEEGLETMGRKLRQSQRLEAMGTLAGGIAHDFNNILGAILGYGEMALRDAPAGTRLRRDLESILNAGERGRTLVDRVLTFSRSSVGARIPVGVENVVREALDVLTAGLPAGIEIEANLAAGRAAMLGEPTQVQQVIVNLATNGIQAMPQGGTLRVSLRTETFDASRAATVGTITPAEYIVLGVVDSGTGIAARNLDRIFEPFFTTKEVNVGNGLGLALVHGIVADVRGAIDVATTPGSGSAFTVYLPRKGDAPDAGSAHAEPPSARGNGQRILVVDDEDPLLRLAAERLSDLGYQPVSFTSSSAAIEAFRADPAGFDAVITDEHMPGVSGSALIREVRRIRKTIPILLVSGFVGAMVTRRAYNEGADEVLKKPLSERDLALSLARIFQR
jgi:PAS domain S-box-containing protein